MLMKDIFLFVHMLSRFEVTRFRLTRGSAKFYVFLAKCLGVG